MTYQMWADMVKYECMWMTRISQLKSTSDQLIPEFTNIGSRQNRLSLKTKFMLTGSIQNIQPLNNLIAIRMNGRLLKRVKKIKYLGSIVNDVG